MLTPATSQTLAAENRRFADTRGISQNNRAQGFVPAFRDGASGRVEISRFSNGLPAPIHLFDGAPAEWVVQRREDGRVLAVKDSIVSGFLRAGRFYTRAEAAASQMH